ncbi:HD-hydrolase domain [Thermodesulfovibrio sp. N1]|nr:HD-hydrolase domain [Thermodesulfovibrio sp. N1]
MKLAGHRILFFCNFDDIFLFFKKMLLIKESAGIVTAVKSILENPESYNENLIISQHSVNVAEMSNRIATMMDEQSKDIKLAGYIHDIGKICIPSSILFSDKNFDDQKIKIFQLHVLWGEVLFEKLSSGGSNEILRDAIGFHHERLNGQGYLRGLKKNIPKIARIIAVSDVYTALTSDRPHRMHYDKDVAITYIISKAGELFDSEVVESFKRVVY